MRALAVSDRWVVWSAFDRVEHTLFHLPQFHVRKRFGPADVSVGPHATPYPVGGAEGVDLQVVAARLCGDACALVVAPCLGAIGSGGVYCDNSIWVLDLAADRTERCVGEYVRAVALTTDLIVGGNENGGAVSLWDGGDGQLIRQFPRISDP